MDGHRSTMPCQQPVGTKSGVQCFATLRLPVIASAIDSNNISDTLPARIMLMRAPREAWAPIHRRGVHARQQASPKRLRAFIPRRSTNRDNTKAPESAHFNAFATDRGSRRSRVAIEKPRPAALVQILTRQTTHISSAIADHAPALWRFSQSSGETQRMESR
jgi:hypothetical protein